MEWHFANIYETRNGETVKVGRLAKPGLTKSEADAKINEAGKQLPMGQFFGSVSHGPCSSEKEALEM